jgi:APA family basic amino acid/polyamine antiporter
MGVIPAAALAPSGAPFADAASSMWGPWAAGAVAAGAAVACFGALNGWTLLLGQMPLAAATDGLLPRLFARLSAHGTPAVGLLISSALVTLVVATNYARGLVAEFTFIIRLSTLTALVAYVFSTLALAVSHVRARVPGGRPVRWPAVPLLAFAYSLWAVAGIGREALLWGSVTLLVGVPIYLGAVRRRAR